ncbi:hypothetical protein EIP91_012117 [Steccherinum ochraceum]|uniref:Glucose-methanol-choline oxidoreductase N-terminal domain-containing protein n=1 Tax=Steccherinum ochraceum TaxID=92696 RepID=A0A4R0RY74_9APHY|nr:hypothetical protein EIP91_012117 [Steccherinum ochraceum]
MLAQLQDVVNKTFDYIIVGGGTAGLTLAARLTEDATRSVLVLESGSENAADPIILQLSSFGCHFGNAKYSWPHMTIPQERVGGAQQPMARGKGLGGSSAINFFVYQLPPADDYNDFERLGNPGWNWENLSSSIRKTQGFTPPTKEMLAESNIKAGLWELGRDGPLKISFPPKINKLEAVVQESLVNAGVPPAPNPLGGNPKGSFIAPNTNDPKTFTRSYAASAYYEPNKHRPNLTVLVNAHVVRVLTETASSGEVVATGVEFLREMERYSVNAGKEVILSSGTIKTPQVLELSGIGDPQVLKKIGVPLTVDLPGVGSNLQDHTMVAVKLELKDDPTLETFDILRDPEMAAKHRELLKKGTGLYTQGLAGYAFCALDMISEKAQEIMKATEESAAKKTYLDWRREQYSIDIGRWKAGSPGIEILTFPGDFAPRGPVAPGKKYLALAIGNFHSISRGTIHCVSNDPLKDPEIDPNYFEEPFDLHVLVQGMQFARKLAQTQPLKDLCVGEIEPGSEVSIDNDEEMAEYVKTHFHSPWHAASSCSMMPKEKGGVVDPQLKVYGTTNVRIVDLSIIPLHLAAHVQATVYGIAERAASIIMGRA